MRSRTEFFAQFRLHTKSLQHASSHEYCVTFIGRHWWRELLNVKMVSIASLAWVEIFELWRNFSVARCSRKPVNILIRPTSMRSASDRERVNILRLCLLTLLTTKSSSGQICITHASLAIWKAASALPCHCIDKNVLEWFSIFLPLTPLCKLNNEIRPSTGRFVKISQFFLI